MADYLGQDFKDSTESIDGNVYDQCTFTSCKADLPRRRDSHLRTVPPADRCTWVWDDAALLHDRLPTRDLQRGGMGPNGRQMVDEIISEIRTPFGAAR